MNSHWNLQVPIYLKLRRVCPFIKEVSTLFFLSAFTQHSWYNKTLLPCHSAIVPIPLHSNYNYWSQIQHDSWFSFLSLAFGLSGHLQMFSVLAASPPIKVQTDYISPMPIGSLIWIQMRREPWHGESQGRAGARQRCLLTPRQEDVAGVAAGWYRWEGRSQYMFTRCTYSDHSFYIVVLS